MGCVARPLLWPASARKGDVMPAGGSNARAMTALLLDALTPSSSETAPLGGSPTSSRDDEEDDDGP